MPLEESCGVNVAVAGRRNPGMVQAGTGLVGLNQISNQVSSTQAAYQVLHGPNAQSVQLHHDSTKNLNWSLKIAHGSKNPYCLSFRLRFNALESRLARGCRLDGCDPSHQQAVTAHWRDVDHNYLNGQYVLGRMDRAERIAPVHTTNIQPSMEFKLYHHTDPHRSLFSSPSGLCRVLFYLIPGTPISSLVELERKV